MGVEALTEKGQLGQACSWLPEHSSAPVTQCHFKGSSRDLILIHILQALIEILPA